MNLEKIKKLAEEQQEKFEETGNKEGMITFDFEGIDIINPFEDETGRFEVDPGKYYGDFFMKSDWILLEKEMEVTNRDLEDHFKSKIEAIITLAIEMHNMWEKVDEKFDERIVKKYPFQKDLLEVIKDLIEWEESI